MVFTTITTTIATTTIATTINRSAGNVLGWVGI